MLLANLLVGVIAAPWEGELRQVYADALEDEFGCENEGVKFWRGAPSDGRMESLPAPVERLLPALREEWLRVGLRAEPANREEAWAAVCDAYEVVGLARPQVQIWLRSPLEGAVGAAMLASQGQVWAQVRGQVGAQVRAQVGAQVRGQVWAQVRAQVGDQVRAQVGDQVWAQVRAQVGAQVRDQVRDQVGAQVRDQVGAQVEAQVEAQVGDQVRDQVYKCGYGSHDAGWVSFYATLLLAGVKCCEKLTPLMRLAHHCGWWWPFENAVILTERPTECVMKDKKLVRARYADGFEVKK